MFAYKKTARHLVSLVLLAFLCVGPVGVALAQQVKVTAADPAETTQGTVGFDVTILGSGFDNTAAVNFLVTGTTNPGGIVVRKVVVHTSKKLVVTIDAAESALLGQYDIEVLLSSGRKGKGTTLFKVLRKVNTAEPDPCVTSSPDYAANWAGFPAFAYVVNDLGANTYQLRVASRNGVCSKRVGDIQPGRAGSTSFASNAPGQFVIAWDAPRIMIARFGVPSVGETASTIPADFTEFRSDGASPADLSPDATSLVYVYGSAALYPLVQIRVASLADATGSSDAVIQTSNHGDGYSVFWAPWDKIYYNDLDSSTMMRRLVAIDPYGAATQAPQVLLKFSATGPLVVNQLFQFGRISGGYAGYDASAIPNVVFQGYYTTGIKKNGASGSWCVSAYAMNAATSEFTLGSFSAPGPIIGFNPSVTNDATVLYEQAQGPTSGASCATTGYLGESALVVDSTPLVIGQPAGSWPAALKTR